MEVTIEHFTNKESFLKLQNFFKNQDFYLNMANMIANDSEINTEEFYISQQYGIFHDDNDREMVGTDIKKIYFQKDFLTDEVDQISTRFKDYIESTVERNYLVDDKESKNFIMSEIRRVQKVLNGKDNFNFLETELYEKLSQQFEQCSNYINNTKLFNNETFDIGKIKVKMSKYDFITLMMALRKNDLIEVGSYDAEFARLIENNFTLYDEDTKSYKSLTDINKLLNGFAKGSKTNELSKKRLSELFNKPDFFQTKEK